MAPSSPIIIAIAVPLGVLAVLGLAAAIFCHRSKRRRTDVLRIADSARAPTDTDGIELRDSSRREADNSGTEVLLAAGSTGGLFSGLREKWNERQAHASARRAVAARRAAVAAAKRTLERAWQRATVLDYPSDADVIELEGAIGEAEAAGVDELAISAALRRLKEVEERAHCTKQKMRVCT